MGAANETGVRNPGAVDVQVGADQRRTRPSVKPPVTCILIGAGFTLALTLLFRRVLGFAGVVIALPIGVFVGLVYVRLR